jgi:hypothetical protein
VSIDKNRGDFLAVIIIALLIAAISLFTPLAFVCCILLIGCAVVLYRLPEQNAGYAMFGMAVISIGVACTALINLWKECPLQLSVAVAFGTMLLGGLWMIQSWSNRRPVLYDHQVNLSTAFGVRQVMGPTRIHRPSALLGTRIISTMSLRQMKTMLRIPEIDVRPSTTGAKPDQHPIRSEVAELLRAYGLMKIHAVDLSVCYRIDGPRWFLLNNIPHPDRHTANLNKSISRDKPEYWEALTTAYINEIADQVVRRVIQHKGWSAADVRDKRDEVSEAFLGELRNETTKMGLIIDQVELLTVDVDVPEDLHQARVGSIHIGLQRDILASMQELLSDPDHPLSAEAIAAIVRSQIRELGRAAMPAAGIEDALDDSDLAQEVGGGHRP